MEVVEMDTVSVLAASNEFDVTDDVTDKDADLSNDRRGSWGNLWRG